LLRGRARLLGFLWLLWKKTHLRWGLELFHLLLLRGNTSSLFPPWKWFLKPVNFNIFFQGLEFRVAGDQVGFAFPGERDGFR
jgi:hypothetical protein